MAEPILIAKHGDTECVLLPAMANRHGLITGRDRDRQDDHAADAGREFQPARRAGLHGRRQGRPDRHHAARHDRRQARRGAEGARPRGAGVGRLSGHPVGRLRDSATQGHPVRATVSDMGPLLLARMLSLNETQQGVLQLVFKIADDNGLAAARPEGPARDAAARRRERERSSRPSTATSARPASARSSAACCRSRSRAATASSASRCSNIADFLQTSTATASSTSSPPTSC